MTKTKQYISINNFTYEGCKLFKKMDRVQDLLNENSTEYQIEQINNIHDKIMRQALDEKKNVVKIINYALNGLATVTEDEIEKYTSSYITKEFQNAEADVVYKVKNANMFFLLEHQSTVDETMAYRIAVYQFAIINSVIKDTKRVHKSKDYKYPQILPIVIYTGDGGWTAKLDLRKKQATWKGIKPKALSDYDVININKISNKTLLEEETTVSKIMLMEKAQTEEEFIKILWQIENNFEQNPKLYTEEEREFVRRSAEALGPTKYKGIEMKKIFEIYKNRGGKEFMFAVTERLNRDRERAVMASRLEGIEEGKRMMLAVTERLNKDREKAVKASRLEGIKEGKRRILKNMLIKNIPIQVICEVTGMTEEEIEKFNEREKNKK